LSTATIAFPVTVLAFAPWWVATITAVVLASLTLALLSLKKSKKVDA
jgi:UDP-GlcNAc:undecaprenyl-phosphate GlcNAc-1-phosphate transferase